MVGKFRGIGRNGLRNNGEGVMIMAKKGMKRFERQHIKGENELPVVPQIQGKAKSGKIQAPPIIAGTAGPELKVWHEPILTNAHGPLDNDLAVENLENDTPYADLQDL